MTAVPWFACRLGRRGPESLRSGLVRVVGSSVLGTELHATGPSSTPGCAVGRHGTDAWPCGSVWLCLGPGVCWGVGTAAAPGSCRRSAAVSDTPPGVRRPGVWCSGVVLRWARMQLDRRPGLGVRDCSTRHRLLLDRVAFRRQVTCVEPGAVGVDAVGVDAVGPGRSEAGAGAGAAGIGDRVALRDRVGLRERIRLARAVRDLAVPNPGVPNPGVPNPRCRRAAGSRAAVPPSRGALNPGVSSRVALNRGALNPRAAEPGAAGTRALNRGAPNLRHRGRRQRGRRCHARTPATPNLSARNAGDAEPGDVEPREAGPACVWTGPAGQDGSWWERAGAPRQKPSRAPERGPVRSTGTRLRALVFHVEHRADGRVPTGAPPTARDAQPSPPRCRLCVTSVTARTRLRPTRPVLGRRPSGAEPVVVRI